MTFYEIRQPRAEADRAVSAEILIYDVIGTTWDGEGAEAKALARELRSLDVQQLDVRINSPGGSMFDGNAIHNALRRHDANVTVHVDGLAASAASIIAMAGDRIVMAPNAMLMIHDPWGMVVGNSSDMRDMAETFDQFAETCVVTYTKRSGMSEDDVRAAMAAETWYGANDAVAAGFADAVEGEEQPIAALARFDAGALARFDHAPGRLVAALTRTAQPAKAPAASSQGDTLPVEASAAHQSRVRELLTRR